MAIRGTDDLWDTTADRITPIVAGDAYDMRLDLPVTADTGSPTEITIELDISSGSTPATVIVTKYIEASKTPPYNVTVNFPIFCGSTFLTNGGQFFAKTDTGTVTITGPAIMLTRAHNGNM